MNSPDQIKKPLEPQPRKKMSILILQLGDLDEVFRSLLALKAIKFLYPEMDLHVVARKACAEPLRHVEWLSSVIEVPAMKTNEEAMVTVAQWIEKVIHQNYDILVNWTSSTRYRRMAALSTSLIPAFIKVGDYIRDDMTLGSFDAWSMYRNAWMIDGVEQDIHFTDIIEKDIDMI